MKGDGYINKICKNCDKSFMVRNNENEKYKKFCSPECRIASRKITKTIELTCVGCSEKFTVLNTAKNKTRKYCTQKCALINRKPTKEELKERGKAISKAIKNKGKIWNKGLTKEDHPSLMKIGIASKKRWEKHIKKHIIKICPVCNKKFKIDLAHKNQICCSIECASIARSGG